MVVVSFLYFSVFLISNEMCIVCYEIKNYMKIVGAGLGFLELTFVKDADVYCGNCGKAFGVFSIEEAMNKRFYSDTCAEGFLVRIKKELHAGSVHHLDGTPSLSIYGVENQPNFKAIITALEESGLSEWKCLPDELPLVSFNQYITISV